MRRFALLPSVLVLSASPALADSGGAAAPGSTVSTGKAGGVSVGAGAAPRAHLSARHAAGRPRIRVRFEEPGVAAVLARVVVLRGSRVVAQIRLGRVRVGRVVDVPWRAGALAAGRYVVRVHARDRWGNQLARSGRADGKTPLVVRGTPSSSPPSSVPPTASGVFPVAGPFVYGDGFGADRGDRSHQGQDLPAARGTPVVAPLGGTVVTAAYQAEGAGYYVVLNATNGQSFFFAHCQTRSLAVTTGQVVATGAALCRAGNTGRSSGPHLHFEIWVGGWRVGKNSRPIDPLPQLKAWAS